jgi:hypothetical protein
MQVDKHKSDAAREVNEINRRAAQEQTQRACVMRQAANYCSAQHAHL